MLTDTANLRPWNELPVWAAVLIIDTAKGLLRPGYFEGWEWSGLDDALIIIHSNGYRFLARRGAQWIV